MHNELQLRKCMYVLHNATNAAKSEEASEEER